MRAGMQLRPHTGTCRERMEKALEEEQNPRWQRADTARDKEDEQNDRPKDEQERDTNISTNTGQAKRAKASATNKGHRAMPNKK